MLHRIVAEAEGGPAERGAVVPVERAQKMGLPKPAPGRAHGAEVGATVAVEVEPRERGGA